MDIKDYIEEQMNSGIDIEDILDSVKTAYHELNEEKMIDNQKKLDAQAIIELELEFVKQYYPNIYKKHYENSTTQELTDDFIKSFELYNKRYCKKEFPDFFNEFFDVLK